MRRPRAPGPWLLLSAVGCTLVSLAPLASAHGFAGFEVYGTQTLGPAGGTNSTYSVPKDGEPRWTLKISYSAEVVGGGGPANITLEVRHRESAVAVHHGVFGDLAVPTEDRYDYYMNWTNPLPTKVKVVYHIAFVGPPTPIELWVVLAGGPALLTAIAFVLVYDLLHSSSRQDETFIEGSPRVAEMRRILDEEDARREKEEAERATKRTKAMGRER